jgi:RNA 3'-terminal phosphate cyclase-like protein
LVGDVALETDAHRVEEMLRYKGAGDFRQRIILSTLSGRPVRIDEIRATDEEVGLRDFEACFLRLVEKVVNGCEVVINETGTAMRYRPGIITGGAVVHDCGTSRAIGYFLQPLLALAPFAKQPFALTLRGITNDDRDVGVDTLRTVTMPMLRHFGLADGCSLTINKRGAPPLGGGEIQLTVRPRTAWWHSCPCRPPEPAVGAQVPTVRELTPVDLTEGGRVKRVRGVAYGTKVSPQVANRLVDSSRGVLNHFLPDVWVYTDLYKGKTSGASAGFALTLVAESTTGALLSAEVAGAAGALPEEVGASAAEALLEEVRQGGAVDSSNQSLALTLMGLGPEDVSRVRLGAPTAQTVETLRLLRDFFGVTFQLSADAADGAVLAACRGVGFKNHAKRTT